jgi:hypothetical protein
VWTETYTSERQMQIRMQEDAIQRERRARHRAVREAGNDQRNGVFDALSAAVSFSSDAARDLADAMRAIAVEWRGPQEQCC